MCWGTLLTQKASPAGHEEVLADPDNLNYLAPLPQALAGGVAPLQGTVMRASTLERYAREASYARVDVLKIDYPLFRFYPANRIVSESFRRLGRPIMKHPVCTGEVSPCRVLFRY
jgi:hypothetical protein